MEIQLDSPEAWIIELHLKNQITQSVSFHNKLLLFRSLGYDKGETLDLSEQELWYLRELISPALVIGNRSGMDVLRKIYQAIVKIYSISIQTPGKENLPALSLEELPIKQTEEVEEDACRDTCEDTSNSST